MRTLNPSVTVSLLRQLVGHCGRLGLDVSSLLEASGIAPDVLASPEARVPLERYDRLQSLVVTQTGDPLFGLRMGLSAKAGNWGILGYVLSTCSDLGQALERFCTYGGVVGSAIACRLADAPAASERSKALPDGAVFRLVIGPRAPGMHIHTQCMEATVSSSLAIVRALGPDLPAPVAVELAHKPLGSFEEYARLLGSPVRFECAETALVFPLWAWSAPLTAPDPALREIFEAHAKRILARLAEDRPWCRKVAEALAIPVAGRMPGLAEVARALAVSPRTLQARLAEEASGFQTLVREWRESRARELLREGAYSQAEIAWLLGFSEPSSFARAFRRWTGESPGKFRACSAG